jgi:hypothetical protein
MKRKYWLFVLLTLLAAFHYSCFLFPTSPTTTNVNINYTYVYPGAFTLDAKGPSNLVLIWSGPATNYVGTLFSNIPTGSYAVTVTYFGPGSSINTLESNINFGSGSNSITLTGSGGTYGVPTTYTLTY